MSPGWLDLLPDAASADELGAGGPTGFGHDFYAACREPDVFRLDFLIPPESRIGSLIQGQADPDGVILACPLEARV